MMSKIAVEGARPVSPEVRDTLLEPFITATRAALGEMASSDVLVLAVYQNPDRVAPVDISAVFRLASATETFMVLGFPGRTAAALATRILAGVSANIDEQLIQDCVGEIGNVVAGQAKTLLAGTPYDFAFSLPRIVVGANADPPAPGLDCLVIEFDSDLGAFALRLFLNRSSRA